MNANEFLCMCNKNSEYCEKFESKTRKCLVVNEHCPVRLIKVDGSYACNTMQTDVEKIARMLCMVIPNNTSFGLVNVISEGDDTIFIFGHAQTDKKIAIAIPGIKHD
jgi:hypothetical protein